MRFLIGRALACVGLGACCTGALAQSSTRVEVELSHDELFWSSQMALLPGDTIYFRVRVTKEGTQTVLGFANMVFQPTISPWPNGSMALPFTNPTTGLGVPDSPGTRGRILPFAAVAMNSSSPSGVLTSLMDGSLTLRFAGANSTGLSDVSRGINCGQLPPTLNTSFNSNTSVVLFKTAIQVEPFLTTNEYVFDIPLAGILQGRAVWFTSPNGANSLTNTLTPDNIHSARAYVGGNPCIAPPTISTQPTPITRLVGQTARFDCTVEYGICSPFGSRWYKDLTPLSDNDRIRGSETDHLRIGDLQPSDAGTYRLLASNGRGSTWSNWATLDITCVADTDDGTGTGTPDGGVTIDDLLYYITIYAEGVARADLDDGSGTGTRDGGVTIDDLLYYLTRFAAGC